MIIINRTATVSSHVQLCSTLLKARLALHSHLFSQGIGILLNTTPEKVEQTNDIFLISQFYLNPFAAKAYCFHSNIMGHHSSVVSSHFRSMSITARTNECETAFGTTVLTEPLSSEGASEREGQLGDESTGVEHADLDGRDFAHCSHHRLDLWKGLWGSSADQSRTFSGSFDCALGVAKTI
jgi:hypothetical protein